MSSEIRCCSYCGKIDYSGQKTECPFCHKSAMLKTGYTQEWYDNIRSQMGEDAPDRIILKRIVKSNPNFNEKLYKRRTKCDYNVAQITGHKKKTRNNASSATDHTNSVFFAYFYTTSAA